MELLVQFRGQVGEPLLASGDEDQIILQGSELAGKGRADPAGGSCDQCCLPHLGIQCSHLVCSSCLFQCSPLRYRASCTLTPASSASDGSKERDRLDLIRGALPAAVFGMLSTRCTSTRGMIAPCPA